MVNIKWVGTLWGGYRVIFCCLVWGCIVAKYKIVITDRDEKIMMLLKKFGYIREDILASMLNVGYETSQDKQVFNQLACRLRKHNIVHREKIKIGRNFYWWLGRDGANLINAKTIRNVPIITIDHDDLVCKLASKYLVENPDINLITEFENKQRLFGFDAKNKKIPDLVIDDNIAIEVEISKKNYNRWNAVLTNYLSSDFKEIIYYTNSKTIANSIAKIASNNERIKFKIFSEDDINNAINYIPDELKNNQIRDKITQQFLGNSPLDKVNKIFGD